MGGLAFWYFAFNEPSCFFDSRLQVASGGREKFVQEIPCVSDELFDFIRVVNLLSLDVGVVLEHKSLNLGILEGGFQIIEVGNPGKKLIECFGKGRVSGQRNGWESVFEMREDVRDGVGVDHPDKEGVGLNAVVEAVQVDKMHGFAFVVVELGHS